MGRYYWSKKEEADDLKKVETWWLKKHGYLVSELYCKSGGIEWTYGWSGDKHSIGISTCTSYIDGRKPHIEFNYTQTENSTGEKKEFRYQVPLVSTPCHYGGERWWFMCPLSKNGVPCGRRVGVLYKSGDYFGCRHCYELTYESRNKNHRYHLRPLFDHLLDDKKVDEIRATMKRSFYAGKPTRKMRRILKINRRMMDQAPQVLELCKK
jgi:hypothetical protein